MPLASHVRHLLPFLLWCSLAGVIVSISQWRATAGGAEQGPPPQGSGGPPSAEEWEARRTKMSTAADARGLEKPFTGVTATGEVVPGLFPIKSTGVSTVPVRKATEAFLAALTPDQRSRTMYGIDDPEWRKWMNQHFYKRQGVSFAEMNDAQREAAFGLLKASLSADGVRLSRDVMRLNHTLGELNNNDFVQYGEGFYWITVMGTPSATEPWGWQLDGHHLIINYYVLGDQVVMTPAFFGSEPVIATSGKFKGTSILNEEWRRGLRLMTALTEAQRAKAIIAPAKTGNNALGEAWNDNLVLDYAGLRGAELNDSQKKVLLSLIDAYIDNMDPGHAAVKMEEIRRHLDDTWFAWIGGMQQESVFYYRVHSPVILIEFDHQLPVGMRRLMKDPKVPFKEHIHTVVRTPNGNDYGKDLLRQHYEQHKNDPTHGHSK